MFNFNIVGICHPSRGAWSSPCPCAGGIPTRPFWRSGGTSDPSGTKPPMTSESSQPSPFLRSSPFLPLPALVACPLRGAPMAFPWSAWLMASPVDVLCPLVVAAMKMQGAIPTRSLLRNHPTACIGPKMSTSTTPQRQRLSIAEICTISCN